MNRGHWEARSWVEPQLRGLRKPPRKEQDTGAAGEGEIHATGWREEGRAGQYFAVPHIFQWTPLDSCGFLGIPVDSSGLSPQESLEIHRNP